jgi:hypothetical protein
LDPLAALLEMFLEIVAEALFEFLAKFIGVLILRGLAEVFDTSEFKSPLMASIGYLILRRSDWLSESAVLPAPTVSSFSDSGAECGSQSRACGTGNVDGGLHIKETEQEGDADRELRVRLRVCAGNGCDAILLFQSNLTAG